MDRSKWRTPQQVDADNRRKAAVIAMKFEREAYSVEEIAKAMNCPVSTVRRAWNEGVSTEAFVYDWFFEKPRRAMPSKLRALLSL